MVLFLLLSSFVSMAHAETPTTGTTGTVVNVTYVAPVVTDEASDATEIPTSQYGVSLVIGSNCIVKVTGRNLSPVKAGQLAGEIETAKAECLAAKARRDDKARADKVAADRSASENTLIAAGAELVKKGGSVDYAAEADGDVRFVSGPAAETRAAFQAYGQMGVVGGTVDMAAYRRVQARVGLALPQVQTVPPPAASTTDADALGECQQALAKKGKMLEECNGS